MATIKLSEDEWQAIKFKLASDYGPAVVLLRDVMRRELGFLPRNYRYWVYNQDSSSYDGDGEYHHEIHLDFYDDVKETFFRMKYL